MGDSTGSTVTVEQGAGGATRTTTKNPDGSSVEVTTGGDSGNTKIKTKTAGGDSSTIFVNGKSGEVTVTKP